VLVEALKDFKAYPNGVSKLEMLEGSILLVEPSDAEFLIKRELVKEAKPKKAKAPKKESKPKVKAKETKPSKKKKETK
jgi:hypothetical protein